MITLYRTDSAGASHYYTLHDRQGHLFSEHSLTVTWGRNLSAAREKVYQFKSRAAMDARIRSLFKKKIAGGYRVLYSYLRSGEMRDMRPVLIHYAVK